MNEQERTVVDDAIARTGELAAEGDLTAAARAFASGPFNDNDIAVAEDAGYFEAAGRYVPHLLNLLQQVMAHQGPTAEDPAVLGAISAPVLVLHGSDTMPFYPASARHTADHVSTHGCGRFPAPGTPPPLTHPEMLARALTEFVSATRRSG